MEEIKVKIEKRNALKGMRKFQTTLERDPANGQTGSQFQALLCWISSKV